MTYHRRRSLAWLEELQAAGVGALVGLAGFYLVRTWLRRSPVEAREAESTSSA